MLSREAEESVVSCERLRSFWDRGHYQFLFNDRLQELSGVPSDLDIGDEQRILIPMLHQYQELGASLKLEPRERIAIAFANRAAIPRGKKLTDEEMEGGTASWGAFEDPFPSWSSETPSAVGDVDF